MSGLPIPPPGTVDENGVFTAAAQSGSRNLTVSAGGRSVTIPVTVSGHIQELDSFETDAGLSCPRQYRHRCPSTSRPLPIWCGTASAASGWTTTPPRAALPR